MTSHRNDPVSQSEVAVVTVEIEPELSELATVRRSVAAAIGGGNADTDALFLIAVTEVVANAIEAHQRAERPETITITVDPVRRSVAIADLGDGFDGPPQDRGGRGDGRSRGLAIAEAVAPGLHWRPNEPRGTVFIVPYDETVG